MATKNKRPKVPPCTDYQQLTLRGAIKVLRAKHGGEMPLILEDGSPLTMFYTREGVGVVASHIKIVVLNAYRAGVTTRGGTFEQDQVEAAERYISEGKPLPTNLGHLSDRDKSDWVLNHLFKPENMEYVELSIRHANERRAANVPA